MNIFNFINNGQRQNNGSQTQYEYREPRRSKPSNSGIVSLIVIIAVTAGIAFGSFYAFLPALNIKNPGFWKYLIGMVVIFNILYWFRAIVLRAEDGGEMIRSKTKRIPLILLGVLIVVPIIVTLVFSSRIFHAKAYSKIITVQDGTVDNLPLIENADKIALMDTSSAQMLGNREIGSLSDVVSQFNVANYTQIDLKGTPKKVAALKYDGFIKWFKNKSNGIPGYIIVDPVSMSAEYVPLQEGMRYVPSAYFGRNLDRHIRFNYPTVMFDNVHFEIDEEGKPWYVATVYDHTIGLFGGKQAVGAIIVDAVSGETFKYDVADVPRWVDVVFDGQLICTQYNDSVQLHDGFINSVWGQTGCRKVTESNSGDNSFVSDYGYISMDGDIWVYTGVTSLNSDRSNIGFILSNERTEETYFITCAGADEFSAMASAQGEVQEKGYIASFPSLVLVDGEATYIMVLKDAAGLVKMYACVNVQQYNIVATAGTQEECVKKYKALIKGNISPEDAVDDTVSMDDKEEPVDTSAFSKKFIVVKKLQTIDVDGNTYIYIVDDKDNIYKAKYTDVIDMLLVEEGDPLDIYTDGENFVLKK